MKTRFFYLTMILTLLFSACDFDLTDIEARQDELEERITALEEWKDEMNVMVSTLTDLVTVIQSRDMITAVEPFTDDNGTGYKLTFVHADPIFVYDGEDGETVEAPVLSVIEEEGIFYWVQTISGQEPEYVLDADGQKVKVDKGEDAVAPKLGIDGEGYWTIDYSDGRGPQHMLDADGQKIIGQVPEGDLCMFSEINIGETQIEFVLASGESFFVPIEGKDEVRDLGTIAFPTIAADKSQVYILKDGAGLERGLIAFEYNAKASTTERVMVFYPRGTNAYSDDTKGTIISTGATLTYNGDTKTDAVSPTEYTTVKIDSEGNLTYGTGPEAAGELEWEEFIMTDESGNKYNTVKLGGNVWTQTNLITLKYANGADIPTNTTYGTANGLAGCGIYGYNDANSTDQTALANKAKYGLLYSFKAVVNASPATLAPEGWDIPELTDFNNLINIAGDLNNPLDNYPNATNPVKQYSVTNVQMDKLTGFNAAFGGKKMGVNPAGKDGYGTFATKTNAKKPDGISDNPNAYCFIEVNATHIKLLGSNFGQAQSVRCVRK